MGDRLVIVRLHHRHRLVHRSGHHLLHLVMPTGHLYGSRGVALLLRLLCHLHVHRLKLVVCRLNEHLWLSIACLAANKNGLSIGGDQLCLLLINGTSRPGDGARVE